MKKLFFVVFALFVPVLLNASEKVYKIGISPDYPPFDTIIDNKISGFDPDFIDKIANIAGIKYEFKAMSFDGLIAALKAGKIDAIASAMSASEERSRACDFSEVYYKAKSIYVKHKDSNFLSKEDLVGKKVGAQLGTVQEKAARNINAIVTANENPTILIMSLVDKKLDALVLDNLVGVEFLKKHNELEGFFIEDDGTAGFSIAFAKGKNTELREKLNKALLEFINSNEYQELLEKYGMQ